MILLKLPLICLGVYNPPFINPIRIWKSRQNTTTGYSLRLGELQAYFNENHSYKLGLAPSPYFAQRGTFCVRLAKRHRFSVIAEKCTIGVLGMYYVCFVQFFGIDWFSILA